MRSLFVLTLLGLASAAEPGNPVFTDPDQPDTHLLGPLMEENALLAASASANDNTTSRLNDATTLADHDELTPPTSHSFDEAASFTILGPLLAEIESHRVADEKITPDRRLDEDGNQGFTDESSLDDFQERIFSADEETTVDPMTGRRRSISAKPWAENQARLQEKIEKMTENIDEHTPIMRLEDDGTGTSDLTGFKLMERHLFEDTAFTLEKGEPLGSHIVDFEPEAFYRKLAEIRAAPISFSAFHRLAAAGGYTEGTEYNRRLAEERRRLSAGASPSVEEVKEAEKEELEHQTEEAEKEGVGNETIHAAGSTDHDCSEEDCSTMTEDACKACYKCEPEPEDGVFNTCKGVEDVDLSQITETTPSPFFATAQETEEHEKLDEMISNIDCEASDFQEMEACELGPCYWDHPEHPNECIFLADAGVINSEAEGFSGVGIYGDDEESDGYWSYKWAWLLPLKYFPFCAGKCIYINIFGIVIEGCAGFESGVGPCRFTFWVGASIVAKWKGFSVPIIKSPGINVNMTRIRLTMSNGSAGTTITLTNECGCSFNCFKTTGAACLKGVCKQVLDLGVIHF